MGHQFHLVQHIQKFLTMQYTSKITFLLALAPLVNAFTTSQTSTRISTGLNAETNDSDMSKAIPFVKRPANLDGSFPGDVGFDPFGFGGDSKESLTYMREAEIKHGRLAMLAVVGWPIAELFDKSIAAALGLPSALTSTGESPSLLNGGLDKIDPEYWIIVLCVAGLAELGSNTALKENENKYIPGDCGFDPLNLFPTDKKEQFEMQTKEIKHGRVAMMAILGFVVQEALYNQPVVAETPFFFTPIWN